MAIHSDIQKASIDDLYLDPKNPRIGRRESGTATQEKLLELMLDFSLEELAVSFLESKVFWPQEALICVEEKIGGKARPVVVEGNRRLAALIHLRNSIQGNAPSRKWKELADGANLPGGFFDDIPYILADDRQDVEAFLGFRHVTGIKQWEPAEKAEYIAKLVEKGMTYAQVMRTIGSRTEPVRRNYISYRILLQIEGLEDDERVSVDHVEEKFSVLFLSLRERGVQKFLQIDIHADPENAEFPVPKHAMDNLACFALWLFGTEKRDPLFTDSRNVTTFGRVLESADAVAYLKSAEIPSFDVAVQKAGADEPELIERVQRATDEIEQTLSRVHLHTKSKQLQKVVLRFGKGAVELLRKFPKIMKEIDEEKS
jgi:hypothetical protein